MSENNDFNNVYGQFDPPKDMDSFLRAMQEIVGQNNAHLYCSQYTGIQTIHIRAPMADFDSELDNDVYLMSGRVRGSVDEIKSYAMKLSVAVAYLKLRPSFEAYDEDHRLIATYPE